MMSTLSTDPDAIEIRTTEILTEHLGFHPIAVLDDIINVVNEIMYKCTEQLEKIFIDRKLEMEQEQKNHNRNKRRKVSQEIPDIDEDDDVIMNDDSPELYHNNKSKKCIDGNSGNYTIQDIEMSTASLETLLEHTINKNFDRFEVYSLRNIFTLPKELVSNGMIRLKHHKDLTIDFNAAAKSKQFSDQYNNLWKEIQGELVLNKVLSESIVKFRKLLKFSVKLKNKVSLMDFKKLANLNNKEISGYIKSLTPLKETYKFLINEMNTTYQKLVEFRSELNKKKIINFNNKDEDTYLNDRISILLKSVRKPESSESKGHEEATVDMLKKLNETLNERVNST